VYAHERKAAGGGSYCPGGSGAIDKKRCYLLKRHLSRPDIGKRSGDITGHLIEKIIARNEDGKSLLFKRLDLNIKHCAHGIRIVFFTLLVTERSKVVSAASKNLNKSTHIWL
jgi:hypothetical protein